MGEFLLLGALVLLVFGTLGVREGGVEPRRLDRELV